MINTHEKVNVNVFIVCIKIMIITVTPAESRVRLFPWTTIHFDPYLKTVNRPLMTRLKRDKHGSWNSTSRYDVSWLNTKTSGANQR